MEGLSVVSLIFEGDLASVLNSTFVVPVAGCVMTAVIVVAGIWSGVRTREMKSQERLAMIAQGLTPEPDEPPFAPTTHAAEKSRRSNRAVSPGDGAGARRAGLILCGIGGGLVAFFAFLSLVVQVREVLSGAAAGLLPLGIGVGFLVDGRLRKREYEAAVADGRIGAPAPWPPSPERTGAASPFAAPPPPIQQMTPAQASDWQPGA